MTLHSAWVIFEANVENINLSFNLSTVQTFNWLGCGGPGLLSKLRQREYSDHVSPTLPDSQQESEARQTSRGGHASNSEAVAGPQESEGNNQPDPKVAKGPTQ